MSTRGGRRGQPQQLNAANDSEFIELLSFLLIIVKIMGNYGKMIGTGMPNILLFILYRKG